MEDPKKTMIPLEKLVALEKRLQLVEESSNQRDIKQEKILQSLNSNYQELAEIKNTLKETISPLEEKISQLESLADEHKESITSIHKILVSFKGISENIIERIDNLTNNTSQTFSIKDFN